MIMPFFGTCNLQVVQFVVVDWMGRVVILLPNIAPDILTLGFLNAIATY